MRLPILLLTLLTSLSIFAQESVFPRGTLAPNRHHTGDVWLHAISRADSTFDYNVTVATFAPHAYLNWHRHPAGQQLLILDGEGLYQERGKDVQRVRRGDVVRCAPGVAHWHASTPDRGVTYLALSGNKPTEWLDPLTEAEFIAAAGTTDQYLLDLSRKKWQWMADKNTEQLAELFHEQAMFIHMGGNMNRERELNVIESGGIHYKKADIHESSVEVMGNTAVVLSRITLLAVVGGREVTNPFTVSETYLRQEDGSWQLGSMAFTKLLVLGE